MVNERMFLTEGLHVALTHDVLAYDEVLSSLGQATFLYVATFDALSKNPGEGTSAGGMDVRTTLASAPKGLRVRFITNIPGRFPSYYSPEARSRATKTIAKYLDAFTPARYPCNPDVLFALANHSKVIATDHCAYVGSANFTPASATNLEAGVLLRNPEAISQLCAAHYKSVLTTPIVPYDGSNQSRDAVRFQLLADDVDDLRSLLEATRDFLSLEEPEELTARFTAFLDSYTACAGRWLGTSLVSGELNARAAHISVLASCLETDGVIDQVVRSLEPDAYNDLYVEAAAGLDPEDKEHASEAVDDRRRADVDELLEAPINALAQLAPELRSIAERINRVR